VNNEPPFDLLQFTVVEVENALLKLDSSKSPCPDDVPPLILKNCASAFALTLCMYLSRWIETLVCCSNFQEYSTLKTIYR
jgi:hypothetical protein